MAVAMFVRIRLQVGLTCPFSGSNHHFHSHTQGNGQSKAFQLSPFWEMTLPQNLCHRICRSQGQVFVLVLLHKDIVLSSLRLIFSMCF
jgi:hypothetical protein